MDDVKQVGIHTQPAAAKSEGIHHYKYAFTLEYISLKVSVILTCHCSREHE